MKSGLPVDHRDSLGRGRGEPGRFSQAHEGVAYGCCVPALTRFTNPHCPGPPRLTQTPARMARASPTGIVLDRSNGFKGNIENQLLYRYLQLAQFIPFL